MHGGVKSGGCRHPDSHSGLDLYFIFYKDTVETFVMYFVRKRDGAMDAGQLESKRGSHTTENCEMKKMANNKGGTLRNVEELVGMPWGGNVLINDSNQRGMFFLEEKWVYVK